MWRNHTHNSLAPPHYAGQELGHTLLWDGSLTRSCYKFTSVVVSVNLSQTACSSLKQVSVVAAQPPNIFSSQIWHRGKGNQKNKIKCIYLYQPNINILAIHFPCSINNNKHSLIY